MAVSGGGSAVCMDTTLEDTERVGRMRISPPEKKEGEDGQRW